MEKEDLITDLLSKIKQMQDLLKEMWEADFVIFQKLVQVEGSDAALFKISHGDKSFHITISIEIGMGLNSR